MAAIDARTGGDVWRTQLNLPLAAGVGSDGRWAAVVSQGAQLIVLDGGREIRRKPLDGAGLYGAAGGGNRVFVLAADRSVSAYDAATATACGASSARASP